MEIFTLLDNLEDLIENSKKVPLSNKIMVEQREALDLIKDVRNKLPEELKALYKVVDEVDGVINGNFVATKPIEGVSMKDTLYGQIDSVASGQKSVADWQKSVEEVSQKLGAAVEK